MGVDLDKLMKAPLRWVPDPNRMPMLVSERAGRRFEMRLNGEFPDTPLYTFSLGDDEYVDFDDLPAAWQVGTLDWPDDAERVPYHTDF